MNALVRAAQPTLHLAAVEVGTPTPPRGRQEAVVATLEAEPRGLWAWARRITGYGRTISLMVTTSRVIKMTRGYKAESSSSIPLSSLAAIHYDYAKPAAKLIIGQLIAMSGLVGIFLMGPQMIIGVLVGGAIMGAHFLGGPKFIVHFSGKDLGHLTLKVDARSSIQRLVQFAEAAAEQLRITEQRPSVVQAPWNQPGFSARA